MEHAAKSRVSLAWIAMLGAALAVAALALWQLRPAGRATLDSGDAAIGSLIGAATPPEAKNPTPVPRHPLADPIGATLVTLRMEDATVQEVVAELALESGFTIEPSHRELVAGRTQRASFDFDQAPFWEVMLAICRQWDLEPASRVNQPEVIELIAGRRLHGAAVVSGPALVVFWQTIQQSTAVLDAPADYPVRHRLHALLRVYLEPKVAAHRIERTPVIEVALDEHGADLRQPPRSRHVLPPGGWAGSLTVELACGRETGHRLAALRGYVAVLLAEQRLTMTLSEPLGGRGAEQALGDLLIQLEQMSQRSASFLVRDGSPCIVDRFNDMAIMLEVADATPIEVRHLRAIVQDESPELLRFTWLVPGVDGWRSGTPAEPAQLLLTMGVGLRELRLPFEFLDVPLR